MTSLAVGPLLVTQCGDLLATVGCLRRNYEHAILVRETLLVSTVEGTPPMPKFVTIGYGDQEGYERTAVPVRDAAHAHDAKLQKDGMLMGTACAPVQVRNTDAAKVETTEGAFMTSALPLAGFAIIEAANIDEAIALVSRTPCAVAHGVVEVWPMKQTS